MTPKTRLNGVAHYGFPLASGELNVRGEGSWKDDHFFTVDHSPREASGAYALFNLRAGWVAPDEHLSIEAIAENLTDKKYFLFAADQTPDFGAVTWERPRWVGVCVRVRY
jgi:outer membrane receptor protein involved in Fe transport